VHQLLGQRDLQLHHVQGVTLDVVQLAGEAHPFPFDGQRGLPFACLGQLLDQVVVGLVGEHQHGGQHGDAGREEQVLDQDVGLAGGHQEPQRADAGHKGGQPQGGHGPVPDQRRDGERADDGDAVRRGPGVALQHAEDPHRAGDEQAGQGHPVQRVRRPRDGGHQRGHRTRAQNDGVPPVLREDGHQHDADHQQQGDLRDEVEPAQPSVGVLAVLGDLRHLAILPVPRRGYQ
jgi:hypothetical protein